MKKILAILLAALMMLSITACSTKGTIWELIGNLSGENGTYEAESSDIEWPWDWTLPGESETDPAPKADEAFVANFKGDWHGYMYWSNATGSFTVNNNINSEMIARFLIDAEGNITPFLAIAVDNHDCNFKNMVATYVDSSNMSLSGTYFFIDFQNLTLKANGNGSLTMNQHVDDGQGNTVDIVTCMRRIGDNSWNESVDYPCFPAAHVEYYSDKDFMFIANSYKLDVTTIPTEGGSDDPATDPQDGPQLSGDVTTVQVDYAGHVFISFPKGWSWDAGYNWIRKDNSSIHIGVDTLLGKTNVQEWRDSFNGSSSTYDNFKFEEGNFNGYSGFRCEMEDWLGATVSVVHDFGGKLDGEGLYGVKFTISGNSMKDLWTEEIQAILNSLELK